MLFATEKDFLVQYAVSPEERDLKTFLAYVAINKAQVKTGLRDMTRKWISETDKLYI